MTLKHTNEYQMELSQFDRIPKSVLAAIAVSFASCGGDNLDEAEAVILDEWRALYAAGIVPQKPVKAPTCTGE